MTDASTGAALSVRLDRAVWMQIRSHKWSKHGPSQDFPQVSHIKRDEEADEHLCVFHTGYLAGVKVFFLQAI